MQYSVVHKSKLDPLVFRLDAEFYHPLHLQMEAQLELIDLTTIKDAKGQLDCSAFYPSIVGYYNMEKAGIPFIRVNEIQNGLLAVSNNTVFLPEEVLKEHKTTIAQCLPGDIVIAKGGNSLGKVAILDDKYGVYAVCRDVLVLRTANLCGVDRYFLWMFLHSFAGQNMLLRTASQTGQPHLTLEAIKKLNIPLFSTEFERMFKLLFDKSQNLQNGAENRQQNAGRLLLAELGLDNWHPQHQLSFFKNYSDVTTAERIDADYFQPKYEEIERAIKEYANGYDALEALITINNKNYVPDKEQEYRYIELSDIGANGEVTGCTLAMGGELPSRARRRVKTGDVIVSSIEGSLPSIAIIDDHYDKSLCSTGFHVIKSQEINPETLLVFLKSIAGQLQLKKGCNGTILTAISKEEFEKTLIPKIDATIQGKIKALVQQSATLRQKSKRLLECAKRAVEMAIEQDEETALKWLEEQAGKGAALAMETSND